METLNNTKSTRATTPEGGIFFFKLFPARGWKRWFFQQPQLLVEPLFFKLFLARGWKHFLPRVSRAPTLTLFFKLFPARGWKRQAYKAVNATAIYLDFFKLFPARGWKRGSSPPRISRSTFSNFSPQGDGNHHLITRNDVCAFFFKLFPARGWKLIIASEAALQGSLVAYFFKLFPARGWKQQSVQRCSLIGGIFFKLFPARGWKHKPIPAPS